METPLNLLQPRRAREAPVEGASSSAPTIQATTASLPRAPSLDNVLVPSTAELVSFTDLSASTPLPAFSPQPFTEEMSGSSTSTQMASGMELSCPAPQKFVALRLQLQALRSTAPTMAHTAMYGFAAFGAAVAAVVEGFSAKHAFSEENPSEELSTLLAEPMAKEMFISLCGYTAPTTLALGLVAHSLGDQLSDLAAKLEPSEPVREVMRWLDGPVRRGCVLTEDQAREFQRLAPTVAKRLTPCVEKLLQTAVQSEGLDDELDLRDWIGARVAACQELAERHDRMAQAGQGHPKVTKLIGEYCDEIDRRISALEMYALFRQSRATELLNDVPAIMRVMRCTRAKALEVQSKRDSTLERIKSAYAGEIAGLRASVSALRDFAVTTTPLPPIPTDLPSAEDNPAMTLLDSEGELPEQGEEQDGAPRPHSSSRMAEDPQVFSSWSSSSSSSSSSTMASTSAPRNGDDKETPAHLPRKPKLKTRGRDSHLWDSLGSSSSSATSTQSTMSGTVIKQIPDYVTKYEQLINWLLNDRKFTLRKRRGGGSHQTVTPPQGGAGTTLTRQTGKIPKNRLHDIENYLRRLDDKKGGPGSKGGRNA